MDDNDPLVIETDSFQGWVCMLFFFFLPVQYCLITQLYTVPKQKLVLLRAA